jgi:hypothetical protein
MARPNSPLLRSPEPRYRRVAINSVIGGPAAIDPSVSGHPLWHYAGAFLAPVVIALVVRLQAGGRSKDRSGRGALARWWTAARQWPRRSRRWPSAPWPWRPFTPRCAQTTSGRTPSTAASSWSWPPARPPGPPWWWPTPAASPSASEPRPTSPPSPSGWSAGSPVCPSAPRQLDHKVASTRPLLQGPGSEGRQPLVQDPRQMEAVVGSERAARQHQPAN